MKKRYRDPIQSFLHKITLADSGSGCWEWTAFILWTGYGRMRVNNKGVYAHRFSYETFVGEIPYGLVIDHLCRNRKCVNPNHLRVVTQRENLLCGDTIPAKHAIKTHCPHGHEYTPENTRIERRGHIKMRNCRACKRIRNNHKSSLGAPDTHLRLAKTGVPSGSGNKIPEEEIPSP